MIKKPRLNLVNRGGGIRANKPAAAAVRRNDPPEPPPPPMPAPSPAPPPEPPPEPVIIPPAAKVPVETEPVHTAESVGRFLAEARKAQGRTIPELAELTHIRDIHLQALEAGAIDRLPGITFVAGFMRLYARHLNIADTDPIEAFLETLDQKRQGLQMEKFPAPTKASHRPNIGLIILGIAALAGCFVAYEHYYAPTTTIPSIPTAPPLRVESSASEGDTFAEPGAVSETVIEKETASTASTPPGTAPNKTTGAALPPAKPAAVEPAPTTPQSEPTSFFSLFGRTSNRISNEADLPPEPEETAPPDPAIEAAGDEEVPGDFDNASLQNGAPPESDMPSATSTTQTPPSVASQTTPIPAASQGNALPGTTSPGTTAGSETAATITTTPEPPQVSPRSRHAGSVPLPANQTPTDPQEVAAIPAAAPPAAAPPAAAPPAPGNAKTKARERVIDTHPVPVYSDTDLQAPNPRSIALIAKELVWIQIQDKDGIVLKDMVMQPEHVFHIPEGETFYAILGNASGVQVRVGDKTLPFLGDSGEVIQDLELSPEGIQKRARGL
ncbi:MAG: DUF4115 domain-containing protein [Magnetococcales bacterium]|nr:DUF4115 domain-containing protein [Magnetococcales bacterium]